MDTLNKIQKELKAPKGQTNNFGKYKYRSCEDIIEAVKTLLGTSTLTLSDELVMIGDRYYIKATACIKDKDDMETVTAYARESLEKKGMDTSQITGSASSYARKYALNGLFLIDDTKDADTMNNRPETNKIKVENEAVKIVLNRCKTMAELVEAWEKLTPAEQVLNKEQKEILKEKLKEK